MTKETDSHICTYIQNTHAIGNVCYFFYCFWLFVFYLFAILYVIRCARTIIHKHSWYIIHRCVNVCVFFMYIFLRVCIMTRVPRQHTYVFKTLRRRHDATLKNRHSTLYLEVEMTSKCRSNRREIYVTNWCRINVK